MTHFEKLLHEIALAARSTNLSCIAVMFDGDGKIRSMAAMPDHSPLSFLDVENIAADFEKITRKVLDRRGGIRPIKDDVPIWKSYRLNRQPLPKKAPE